MMNERTKLGLGILEAALLLGLLGDALLRAKPWGLNVLLWFVAFVAALTALLKQKHIALAGEGSWLLPCGLLFAAFFAWRDSLTLRFLDALSILVLLALVILRTREGRIRLAGLSDYALALLISGANAIFGMFPLVFIDVRWREIPRAGWSRHVLAIVRGLAIAVPLLLIFGALLMAADSIFERLISNTFPFEPDLLLRHLTLILFFAWVTGGFMRGMLLGRDAPFKSDRDAVLTTLGLDAGINGAQAGNLAGGNTGTAKTTAEDAGASSARWHPTLGIVEIGIVLGLLDVLFFSFVVVQLRYLFGGANHVLTSAGLTYADYARRGFFELVWVAALVLPLLLFAHWLLGREKRVHERIFRVLAGAMVALLFVIMVSALKRMRLYQSEYGLTELRLYTTAFMGWLGVVFVWFTLTVLVRGRREQFAVGALIAALCATCALHFVNPDAFIVRTNLLQARGSQHRRFDASYTVSLGADAFPSLIAAIDEMDADERRLVARSMVDWLAIEKETDWRSWNWSRAAARSALAAREATLEEWAAEPKVATPVESPAYQHTEIAPQP